MANKKTPKISLPVEEPSTAAIKKMAEEAAKIPSSLQVAADAFNALKPRKPTSTIQGVLSNPLPSLPPMPVDQNLASEFNKRLKKWISDFDKSLDNEHEVGVRLVNFGQTITFHLEGIGYWNPSLISFSGVSDSGDPVELIQHVSQISILLMKLKRKNPEEPKRPIGFAEWPEE